MWFIGVAVEQETSAPPPKKNPRSAPDTRKKPLKISLKEKFNEYFALLIGKIKYIDSLTTSCNWC